MPNVHDGFLIKMGHRTETLTRRWFVVTPGRLSYYSDEAQAKQLGELLLMDPVGIDVTPQHGDGEKFEFRVSNSENDLLLTAPTDERMQGWIQAIKANTVQAPGGA